MTLDLKLDDSFELEPICKIKEKLDTVFGKDKWADLEIETISLELKIQFSKLAVDKITVLQGLAGSNEFYTDPLFFVYCVEVVNNNIADFDIVPLPSSLEVVYAIKEIQSLYPGEFENGIKRTITYILKTEGYSRAPKELEDLVFEEELRPGQEAMDMSNKEKAIDLYLEGMANGTNGS